MTRLLLAALALGVGGFDPAAALVGAAALGAGARERVVVAYAAVVLVVTTGLGAVLSMTVGARLADFRWSRLLPPDQVNAWIGLLLGVGLLVWGIQRSTRSTYAHPGPKEARGTGPFAMVAFGCVYGLATVFDPAFVAMVVIAGRISGQPEVLAAWAVWTVLAQLPLVVLLVALLRGSHGRSVLLLEQWWRRARPALRWVVTGALLLSGGFLVLDAVWWFTTGGLLVPLPR
ncbi:MAG: hypothetical protein JJE50_10655 [Actinomycetales bacterium]|nr:hypothetical protein [Actinomycetales bacterium]